MFDEESYRSQEEAESYEAFVTTAAFEHAYRVREVRCDICNEEDQGTSMQLERRGWWFGRGQEICGLHGEF